MLTGGSTLCIRLTVLVWFRGSAGSSRQRGQLGSAKAMAVAGADDDDEDGRRSKAPRPSISEAAELVD